MALFKNPLPVVAGQNADVIPYLDIRCFPVKEWKTGEVIKALAVWL